MLAMFIPFNLFFSVRFRRAAAHEKFPGILGSVKAKKLTSFSTTLH
jgi:hypothetical protein